MSAEDELRAAAREHRHQLDATREREEARLARREAATRTELARADDCGAELDETVSAFLKLMWQSGNPGCGRLTPNKRKKGWRVLDIYEYETGRTRWMLFKSGEWDLENGLQGSSRQVLRDLAERLFRGDPFVGRSIHPSINITLSPDWVDGQAAAMRRALAETLATNGVT